MKNPTFSCTIWKRKSERRIPETGVNTYAGLSSMDTLHLISGKMAPFVRAMLDSGEYDEFSPGMVLDIYQLLPEDYIYLYTACFNNRKNNRTTLNSHLRYCFALVYERS